MTECPGSAPNRVQGVSADGIVTGPLGRGRRILMFTPGHSEAGGAAKRSRLLAEGLAEAGREVRVVARRATGMRFAIRREPRLTVVEVPGLRWRLVGAGLYYLVAIPLGLVWVWRADRVIAVQLAAPAMVGALIASVSGRCFAVLTTAAG